MPRTELRTSEEVENMRKHVATLRPRLDKVKVGR
jgi:hypothetical protein